MLVVQVIFTASRACEKFTTFTPTHLSPVTVHILRMCHCVHESRLCFCYLGHVEEGAGLSGLPAVAVLVDLVVVQPPRIQMISFSR